LTLLSEKTAIYQPVRESGAQYITVTGYYLPEIPISKRKTDYYNSPILSRPSEIIKPEGAVDFGIQTKSGLKPYLTREQIEKSKSLEKHALAWANNVDLLNLHIQGSGYGRYENGEKIGLGFDGTNGHAFVSPQRVLIKCNVLDKPLSADKFFAWLKNQSENNKSRYVNLNPRYIFYRLLQNGALGSMRYPIIDNRSVAIDKETIPLGIPAILIAHKPIANKNGKLKTTIIANGETHPIYKKFARIVATHDTGAAIQGTGRLDLFWGSGKAAWVEAGSMYDKTAQFFILIPKK
jgi:peptidoglycan lytic transglycosylase A